MRAAEPLGVAWIHGSPSAKHNADPGLQVHWYDEDAAWPVNAE